MLSKIWRFIQSFLKDASHPIVLPKLIGFLLLLVILPLSSLFEMMTGQDIPLLVVFPFFMVAGLFAGFSGYMQVKRKEMFDRSGTHIRGREAVIWGWVIMLFCWGSTILLVLLFWYILLKQSIS